MHADGTVQPAVKVFRKYKHTELGYLTTIAEMRHAEHSEPIDLVAQMAQHLETSELVQAADTVRHYSGAADSSNLHGWRTRRGFA